MTRMATRALGRALWLAAFALVAMSGPGVATDGVETRPNWIAQRADATRTFNLERRGIALDGNGDPHLAYGQDRLYYASSDAGVWTLEVADNLAGVGVGASLVLDGAGAAHIAHLDGPNDRVLYTTNASGSWATQQIDTITQDTESNFNFFHGDTAFIALDEGGDVHVVYHDPQPSALRYATNATGAWVAETIETDGAGAYRSLVLDDDGNAHIAYNREGEPRPGAEAFVVGERRQTLRYATNASGRWRSELVDDGRSAPDPFEGVGQESSILLDSTGAVHIVYRDENGGFDGFLHGGVVHSTKTGGRWTRTRIGSFRTLGGTASAAIDAADTLHVSFWSSNGIEYARNTGSGWTTETVFAEGGVVSAIEVGADGTVHIASTENGLRVASGTSGSFTNALVDTAAFAGNGNAIVVDAAGAAHVCHTRSGDFVYTSNAAGGWQSEIVDTGTSAFSSGIGLDPSENVHVAYSALVNGVGELRFAHDTNGSWTIQTVDATPGNSFGSTGLAMEGTIAHIASHRIGANTLVYATNASGSFVLQEVATSLLGMQGVSIAVDASGDVHLAYGASSSGSPRAFFYATNASGSWVVETVDSGMAFSPRGSIGLATDGTPHVVFEQDDRVVHGVRTPSGWDLEVAVPAPAGEPQFAFDVNDDIHIAYERSLPFDDDLGYATNQGGAWRHQIVDRGGLGGRAFGDAHYTAREGGPAATIPIVATGRVSVGNFPSIATDANCGAHIAYPDLTLGDLKYAFQSATVPSPTVTVDYDVAAGTATANLDFTPVSGTVGWGDDDSGSKLVVVPIEDDDLIEGGETIRLSLSNPTGNSILNEPSSATLLIQDDDVAPEGSVVAYLLPRNLRLSLNKKHPEKSRLIAAGFIDTGPGDFDPSGPATLQVGDISISVPGMVEKRGGFDFRKDGLIFRLIPARRGGSRARFRMVLTSNRVNQIEPDSQLRMRFRAGSVDASGEFALDGTRYVLGRVRGTLIDPVIYPFKAVANLKGAGKDKLFVAAGLNTLGDPPTNPPDVRIAFASVFQQTVASGDFKPNKDGSRFTYTGAASGLAKVILDYERETLTAIGKGLDLGAFADGEHPVLITVEVDGVDLRNVAVRMRKKGKAMRY